jgi:hypothetical protein
MDYVMESFVVNQSINRIIDDHGVSPSLLNCDAGSNTDVELASSRTL